MAGHHFRLVEPGEDGQFGKVGDPGGPSVSSVRSGGGVDGRPTIEVPTSVARVHLSFRQACYTDRFRLAGFTRAP